ncbi:hypothetical protein IWQ49_006476 [Labrenzia sp. EL_126]|nr:hypothetical protein [Labrenzia sp. EL_126]
MLKWFKSIFVTEIERSGSWGLKGIGSVGGFILALVLTDQLSIWWLALVLLCLVRSPSVSLIVRFLREHENEGSRATDLPSP